MTLATYEEWSRALTQGSPPLWSTPRLVVLRRGTLEENVLALCKISGRSGPKGTYDDCVQLKVPQCMRCNNPARS